MPSINVNVITLFIFRFRGTRRHPANLPSKAGLAPRWTKVQNVVSAMKVMPKTAFIVLMVQSYDFIANCMVGIYIYLLILLKYVAIGSFN